ncbi:hypothetical protein HII27_07385 [Kluyvera sp. SCKS090646]|uniref:Uncharacterized protein n=1 Tax=Kluyvera sichuanensis TaxID=2725494 RepID=A0ABR6RR97_9ENTR|nr:hypothetical protein [Kluyvera sichuanensis]MBC1185539.1 hypothetical protein [Kluyvera sichuanensis]
MQEVIVFEFQGGTAVMSVASNIGMTTLEIGKKDVPSGVPFWIVDAAQVSDSFSVDQESMGEPSGFGKAGDV